MVHVIAPKAKIVLEAAKTANDGDLYAAVKDAYMHRGATVVSMSFGGSESTSETGVLGDGIFSAGNAKGVSFTASSGDNGTGAQYPASSPYVTSVGGTTLHVQNDGRYISETAWSGSGGGLSAYEKVPSYQTGVNKSKQRGVPDVAMVADPNTGVNVYDSFGYNGQKGFFIVGGTSVAAPLFAGVLALVNQGRTHTLQNANTQIYPAAKSRYAKYFHDIASGSNGSCGKICTAHSGYDTVTGLGSPLVNNLVPALIAAAYK
jgi:subtilase family serine protease